MLLNNYFHCGWKRQFLTFLFQRQKTVFIFSAEQEVRNFWSGELISCCQLLKDFFGHMVLSSQKKPRQLSPELLNTKAGLSKEGMSSEVNDIHPLALEERNLFKLTKLLLNNILFVSIAWHRPKCYNKYIAKCIKLAVQYIC